MASTGNPVKPNEEGEVVSERKNSQKAALGTLGSVTQRMLFQIPKKNCLEAKNEICLGETSLRKTNNVAVKIITDYKKVIQYYLILFDQQMFEIPPHGLYQTVKSKIFQEML